jgi:hypothetical protein
MVALLSVWKLSNVNLTAKAEAEDLHTHLEEALL